jgi:beta-lactamase superfamily II metal-dependent hydrolase
MSNSESDAVTPRYFLLDMGKEKYGDCILCLVGGKRILIDGGHPGDFDGQPGSASIPDQIGAILNVSQPYRIDLLVVTHCHLDHIGCLPRMVQDGVLDVKAALVADERLGWGKKIGGTDSDVLPDSPLAARVVAALREEARGDDFEDSAAIERFLDDAVTLEDTYKKMLRMLADRGTTVVRYGRDDISGLVSQFSGAGLKVLGPTKAHLEICRRAIETSMQDAVADAVRLVSSDATLSDVDAYRRLVASSTEDATADGSRLGAALNDQSIIIALGPASNRVLLTGDMQFSDPGLNGLDAEMTALRKTIKNAGPYKFVKLAHHGSHNGIDADVRADWAATKLFGISGGSHDPSHPAREALKLLKAETQSIMWARTDKNGRIEIRPASASQPLQITKGSLNNSTANPRPPQPHDVVAAVEPSGVITGAGNGSIEITARVPNHLRRVVISIDSELRTGSSSSVVTTRPTDPEIPARRPSAALPAGTLAGGRTLPPLLFVSNRRRLRDNIGNTEADAAIAMIENAGQTYLDVTDSVTAVDRVRERLSERYRGVVLLGGYDILAAKRLDTLPPEIRASLGDQADIDADNFIVWSDALYGDMDMDDLPELPVTRIPDGKSSQLVLSALTAKAVDLGINRFSIYNAKRPFATEIVELIPGVAEALASLPETAAQLEVEGAAVPLVYFMLHGLDNDATHFVGQEPEYPEAFNIDQVPANGGGVVFTGCCWGALTVRQIASRVLPGRAITPRTPEQSIALRYLQAGYNAFIGCTGSHYSPPELAMSHGKPMHVEFWTSLGARRSPAEALLHAKVQYLRKLPHEGVEDVWDIAVEHKILRQFTCLGLGW